MSELYNVSVEIYSYSNIPMRKIIRNDKRPLRLSFHGHNHYNSVTPTNWRKGDKLTNGLLPTYHEDARIAVAKEYVKMVKAKKLQSQGQEIVQLNLQPRTVEVQKKKKKMKSKKKNDLAVPRHQSEENL